MLGVENARTNGCEWGRMRFGLKHTDRKHFVHSAKTVCFNATFSSVGFWLICSSMISRQVWAPPSETVAGKGRLHSAPQCWWSQQDHLQHVRLTLQVTADLCCCSSRCWSWMTLATVNSSNLRIKYSAVYFDAVHQVRSTSVNNRPADSEWQIVLVDVLAVCVGLTRMNTISWGLSCVCVWVGELVVGFNQLAFLCPVGLWESREVEAKTWLWECTSQQPLLCSPRLLSEWWCSPISILGQTPPFLPSPPLEFPPSFCWEIELCWNALCLFSLALEWAL